MWRYYAQSNICYVYMVDVPDSDAGWGHTFKQSEWFTRGWTLQELIAPVCVEFYAANWDPIGTKFERHKQLTEITSIHHGVLVRYQTVDMFSAAERLSWAAHRKVTREEDEAYSLLGLFNVNMPLLYGEGREKAFVRLQEAVYNSTADHSMFLYRHSPHDQCQPLLADSPTRFCERKDCVPCLSLQNHCLPLTTRYTNIIESEIWRTQAHAQVHTTDFNPRKEMSTVLPLLAYRDVSSKLQSLNGDRVRTQASHVAVLNHTLGDYPRGALCLLLRKDPGLDVCLRLQAVPVLLPHFEDLESRLQRTMLLVCPGPRCSNSNRRIVNALFSVESDSFYTENWNAKGTPNNPIRPVQQGQNFEIQTTEKEDSNRLVQVSCRVVAAQGPELRLTVKLVRVDQIWSIREVFERKKGTRERKLRTLFATDSLSDCCTVRMQGRTRVLSVRLRRLPGCVRTSQEDNVSKVRYQILIRLDDK
jgi:hypothetical protein